MICVTVTYVVKPGREEEAIACFANMVGPTRAEPGCLMYLAHRSLREPSTFFLYEQYADEAALDYHRSTAHFETYMKNGLFHLIESRTAELYEPLSLDEMASKE